MSDRKLTDHFSDTESRESKLEVRGKLLAPSHMLRPCEYPEGFKTSPNSTTSVTTVGIHEPVGTPPKCVFGCEHV